MSIIVTQYPDDIQLIPSNTYNTGTGSTIFEAYDTDHKVLCFKLYAVVPIGNDEYERVYQFGRTSPGESGQQKTKDAMTYFRMSVSKTEGYNYRTTIKFSKVKIICFDRSVQYRTISGADNIQEYNSPQLSVEYRFLRECRFECDIYTSDDPTNIETVSFTVYWPTVNDDPRANIQYQWYCSKDHGDTWFHVYYPPDVSPNNIYDSSIYKFPALSTYHGRQYKCRIYQEKYPITDSYYTDPVIIDIHFQAPTIARQPSSFELAPNSTKSMSIQADGSEISYQWQKNSANDWIDIEGAIKATYNVIATSEEAGNIDTYRCKVYNKDHTVYSNDIIVTILNLPPEIEIDLADQTTHEGDETTLSFTVNGQELSYQWYKYIGNTSTKIEGATLPAYTFTPTYADKNTKYYCIVSNDGGTVQSRVATLNVLHAIPVITIQPQNASVIIYNTARFAIEATGANKKYQWEEKIAGVWVPISGKTSTSYSILADSPSLSGREYHCIVSNDGGEVVSDTVTLTVLLEKPKITTQPKSIRISAGGEATFTIVASGTDFDLQWQQLVNNTWTDLVGKTDSQFLYQSTDSEEGNVYTYRCKVYNTDHIVYSNEVTLTINYIAPVIDINVTDQTAHENTEVTFTFTPIGNDLSYQWYKYANNNTIKITGANAVSYTFTAQYSDNKAQYYCVVKNSGGEVQTRKAILTVKHALPVIILQPQNTSVVVSNSATFSIDATGENLKFQWEEKIANVWTPVSGKTSKVYTKQVNSKSLDGLEIHCLVENDGGTIVSNTAILSVVNKAPVITSNPSDLTVHENEYAEFVIVASGNDITYQWKQKINNAWVNIPGADSPQYGFDASIGDNHASFKCYIENDGGSAESKEAILIVHYTAPVITIEPEDAIVYNNKVASFTVTASGESKAYQWQKKNQNVWTNISGANADTYSFIASLEDDKTFYKCIVSNNGGSDETSEVMLTVLPGPIILVPPESQTVIEQTKVTFSISVQGEGITYQWQKKVNDDWTDISGQQSASYTFTATLAYNDTYYRCVVENDSGTVESDEAHLTVLHTPPSIKTQPLDQIVHENETATFTVEAIGNAIEYKWQKYSRNSWIDIPNTNSPSYSLVASLADNNSQFQCIAKNTGGTITFNTVTLTVLNTAPVFTVQPQNKTVDESTNVTFAAEASGNDVDYQWQTNIDGVWVDIENEQDKIYTFRALLTDNGKQYKCIASNDGGSVDSNVAELTVNARIPNKPVIITQPRDLTVHENIESRFIIEIDNEEDNTLQWQIEINNEWSNIYQEKSPIYQFTPTLADNQNKYRCEVKNSLYTIYSDEVTLTVQHTAPTIATEPTPKDVYENTVISFAIRAVGEELEYQWQRRIDNAWRNIEHANADIYTFTVTIEDDDTEYRCIVFNDGGKVITTSALLNVKHVPPKILNKLQDQTVYENTKVTLSVETVGEGLEYQWQRRADNDWVNIGNENLPIYEFNALHRYSGTFYRCIVHNDGGSVESNEMLLTVWYTIPIITTHPKDQLVSEGKIANFSVAAIGEDLHYQWKKNINGIIIDIQNANNYSYSFTVTADDDKTKYFCEVSNDGGHISTNEALLSIKYAPPVIEKQPESVIVKENETAVFTIKATGNDVEYQWQYNIDGTWTEINGQTTDAYSVLGLVSNSGMQVQCIVSNNGGKVLSNIVLLTIRNAPPKISSSLLDQVVHENDTVIFTIDAVGNDLEYQWEKNVSGEWSKIVNEKSDTYQFTALYRYNDTNYRCVVKNNGGEDVSNEAHLTVKHAIPIITNQPQNQTVIDGKNVIFSIIATGEQKEYQWKKKIGNSIIILPNAKNSTYSFIATLDDNNTTYFCEVSNDGGSIESDEALLTVTYKPPIITKHPTDLTVYDQEDAVFTVEATGEDLHYQWQQRITGEWRDIDIATDDPSYMFVANLELNKFAYRCIVHNDGGQVISNIAIITIKNAPPKIIEQPSSVIIRVGEEALFTIFATGNNLRYQWQKQTDGIWYSVATTESYRYAPTTYDYEKIYTYRCLVTDEDDVTIISDMVTLTILEALPTILDQSSNQLVYTGENIDLFVQVDGKNLRYQWQKYQNNDWVDILDASDPRYIKEDASDADDNTRYKCKVENNAGYVTSKEILITFCPSEPIILGHPTSITVLDGDEASFAIEATGKDIRYQWQSSIDQGFSWTDIRNTNVAEYSFITSTSITGYQYRCVVTNVDDISAVSDSATLTVNTNNRYSLPVITTQPNPATITEGESVNLTVEATGENLGYQWQINRDNTYYAITDATEPTYVVVGGVSMSGSIYRCVVSNPAGSVISNEVSVIVQSASAMTMPTIVNQPTSIAVLTGTFSGFRLYATGGGLAYQWYRQNGGVWYPVPNATSPIYETTFTYEKEGSYRCEVTNVAGTVFSDTVTASIVEETNLDIHGYHSIFISGKNTYAEWEMYPTSRPHVASPEVKTNYVNLPGANGGFDYTELLIGEPTYGYRKGSWEFMLIPQERWAEVLRSLETYLHGRIHTVVLEDDLSYEYRGRLSVNKWESLQHNSTIVIDYTLEPVARNRGGETFNPDESDLQAATRILMKPEHINDAIILWHNTANIVNLDTLFEDGDDIAY